MKQLFKKDLFRVLFVFFCVVGLTIVSYGRLPDTFYQQDEWHSLGQLYGGGFGAYTRYYTLPMILSGAGRLLSLPISAFFYLRFPMNALPFVIWGFVFHIFNAILVYLLSMQITKRFVTSFLAACLFTITSVSHQALTWPAAVVTTTTSTFFLLLSLYLLLLWIEKKRFILYLLTIVTAFVAFYFKESTAFVFLLFPLFVFLFDSNKHRRLSLISVFIPAGFFILIIVSIRLIGSLQTISSTGAIGRISITPNSIVSNMFVFPFVVPFHYVVFSLNTYAIAKVILVRLFGDYSLLPDITKLIEVTVSDGISFIGSLIIYGISFITFVRYKTWRLPIISAMVFLISSIFPLIILNRPASYMESRYYYTGIFGYALFFGVFFTIIIDRMNKHGFIRLFSILIFITFYFTYHIGWIRNMVEYQVKQAVEQKRVMADIKRIVPDIPDKTLFYIPITKSHIIETNPLPFQIGSGWLLMIMYKDYGIPKSFFLNDFLWNIGETGYKEEGTHGFGIATTKDKLLEIIKLNQLNRDSIMGITYATESGRLVRMNAEELRLDTDF